MSEDKGRITGFGGVFIKSTHPQQLKEWYRDMLGVDITSYGACFLIENEQAPGDAYSVWSVFAHDSDYFDPSKRDVMINFRVDDLDALLAKLKDRGVPLIGAAIEESYGKFAWIVDPDGTKIELWQQIGPIPDAAKSAE